jgi:hypothetical protein
MVRRRATGRHAPDDKVRPETSRGRPATSPPPAAPPDPPDPAPPGGDAGATLGGWQIIEDCDAQMPTPAEGRIVLALPPPTESWRVLGPPPPIDSWRDHKQWHSVRIEPPPEPRPALAWTTAAGREVLHCLSGDGCLLGSGHEEAGWLPERWQARCYPAGWTLPHLEAWFAYALDCSRDLARGKHVPDGPAGLGPDWLPSPRGLVHHAHLIVRHLALPDPPTEPRGEMTTAGCLAELDDVLDFFRAALSGEGHALDPPPMGDGVPPPEWMSAQDLAALVGQTPDAVRAWLQDYRKRYPDCYQQVDPDDRLRGDAQYLYRTADVLPHLRTRPQHRRRSS